MSLAQMKYLAATRWGVRLGRLLCPQRGYRVISFHCVLPDAVPPSDYRRRLQNPTVSEFEALMIGLQQHFPIFPLIDLVTGRAPTRSLALGVSFDDGYQEVASLAAPILASLGVPYTVFLTTSLMDGHVPWFSRMYVFAYSAGKASGPVWLPPGCHARGESDAALERALSGFLRQFDTPRIHEIIDEIERRNPWYSPPSDLRTLERFMNWDEVRVLGRSPLVTFGAHTETHPALTALNSCRLEEELVRPRVAIESHIGQPCRLIAYPMGVFSERLIAPVQASGYEAGFLMRPGLNTARTHRFLLHREYVPLGPALAIYQLSGLGALGRRLRAAVV